VGTPVPAPDAGPDTTWRGTRGAGAAATRRAPRLRLGTRSEPVGRHRIRIRCPSFWPGPPPRAGAASWRTWRASVPPRTRAQRTAAWVNSTHP